MSQEILDSIKTKLETALAADATNNTAIALMTDFKIRDLAQAKLTEKVNTVLGGLTVDELAFVIADESGNFKKLNKVVVDEAAAP